MNFDDAKENIQPLAEGRNVDILQASLRVEATQLLRDQRCQLEKDIVNYNGDDPLEPWYAYITWIEQSYPSGGKESGLEEVLTKCLSRFDKNERYNQDRRMIKLYIKFIDSHRDQSECYQQMYDAGIGTMVADFYICWAYCYELRGNSRKASDIFKMGKACRAEPTEQLQEAYQHFCCSVAQRHLGEDDLAAIKESHRELNERRLALTSLRDHRKVGSVRTGAAVKSYTPGTIKYYAYANCSDDLAKCKLLSVTEYFHLFKLDCILKEKTFFYCKLICETCFTEMHLQSEAAGTSKQNNNAIQVLYDENDSRNTINDPAVNTDGIDLASAPEERVSVARSIIEIARNQENQKEPGPWDKAHDKKNSKKLFGKKHLGNDLQFPIHEDNGVSINTATDMDLCVSFYSPIVVENNNLCKPFKYPPNFKSKNRLQPLWNTPVTTDVPSNKKTLPEYNKCMIYPRPNMEFQCEELIGYRRLKKDRIKNAFTQRCDAVWKSNDITVNLRQYPNFAKCSLPQVLDDLDKYYEPSKKKYMVVPFKQIYQTELKEEYPFEMMMVRKRHLCNETIIQTVDMEETVCLTDRNHIRKSFFPIRKSLIPQICEATSKIRTKELEDDTKYKEKTISEKTPMMQNLSEILSCDVKAVTDEDITKNVDDDFNRPTEFVVSPVKNKEFSPFEIYEDTTNTFPKVVKINEQIPSVKLKPRSIESPIIVFTEHSTEQTTDKDTPFGLEETEISTQIFNLHLISHFQSTPKAQKRISQRASQLATDQNDENDKNTIISVAQTNSDNEEKTALHTVGALMTQYSPPKANQLSTILETSEHYTQTTGASTKSTISSPEIESQFNAGILIRYPVPHVELETVQEQSHESSMNTVEVKEQMESIKPQTNLQQNKEAEILQSTKKVEKMQKLEMVEKVSETPANMRLERDINKMSLEKEAGNFTRLVEREDITPSYFVRPLIFQEENTDTMSKVLLASRYNSKLLEDKTETIPKINFLNKYEEDITTTTGTALKLYHPPSGLSATNRNSIRADDSIQFIMDSPPNLKKMQYIEQSASVKTNLSDLVSVASVPISVTERTCDNMSKLHFSLIDKMKNNAASPIKLESFPIHQASFIADEENFSMSKKSSNADHDPLKPILRPSFFPNFSFSLPDSDVAVTKESIDAQLLNASAQSSPQSNSLLSKFSKMTLAKQNKTKWEETICSASMPNTKLPHENILMDDFVKDFSNIKESCRPIAKITDVQHKNETLNRIDEHAKLATNHAIRMANGSCDKSKWSFSEPLPLLQKTKRSNTTLNTSRSVSEKDCDETPGLVLGRYFEPNINTYMFTSNNSMIKNSTWLPDHDPYKQLTPLKEDSLHINAETSVFVENKCSRTEHSIVAQAPLTTACSEVDDQQDIHASSLTDMYANPLLNIHSITKNTVQMYQSNQKDITKNIFISPQNSVYDTTDRAAENNFYEHKTMDLDQTNDIIKNICIDVNVNPFQPDLINSFLDQIQFQLYIDELSTCELVKNVSRLHVGSTIKLNNMTFNVRKMIGEGAYSSIFCGEDTKTGKRFAMKQQFPPNFWEYYICLEVRSRLMVEEMLPAFANVEYALFGHNSSILLLEISPYGSLIDICNTIKKVTMKNIDELIVMHLACELLEIVDHLHAMEIIHADIKPDNVLLMNKLSYPSKRMSLQLIDFGISIDMRLFRKGQTFLYSNVKKENMCVEMCEKRAWTYQLDLHCVAGIIHVMLFGQYMKLEKRSNGTWMHKTAVPRYFNKTLWETIFKTLLNIRDCKSMPDLQQLRILLKEELAENEKLVLSKIAEFNNILNQKK